VVRQLAGELGTSPDIVGVAERGRQVLDRLRTMQRRLRKPEQAQHGGPLGVRGRLRERARQVGARGFGRTRRQRVAGNLAEQVDEQRVPPRLHGEQVSRDRVERSPRVLEKLRRPGMPQAPPVGRYRVVDRRVDDRMDELERLARTDEPSRRQ
jgi:hypothetical protein